MEYDLAIIGGGPGGYVAAIRAGQLGMRVVCIEERKHLGGTCLNVGCIPSKALLHSTELFAAIRDHGAEHGIHCDNLRVDFGALMKRKEQVVEQLGGGIDQLFKKNKVERMAGRATLAGPNRIDVEGESVQAKQIILATGSEPIPLPFLPFDEQRVVSSTGALALQAVPKKLVLVGAGVIGLELGSVYRRLGAEVEVVEFLDHICPSLDRAMSKALQKALSDQGMTFHLSKRVSGGQVGESSVHLEAGDESFDAEVVLVAIGRRPYSEGLGLEEVGISQDEQGRVVIDGYFRTSVPSIRAIGDLVNGPMLAHKAEEEGVAVVELIAGQAAQVNYLAIPNVVYTFPEVACVGMTEEQAKAHGLDLKTGTFSLKANSRARATGEDVGMVKIIAESTSDRLIGMHIIGPRAGEMIHEGVVAIEKRVTVRELAAMSHAHPTFSEAIKEACLAVHKQQIHS